MKILSGNPGKRPLNKSEPTPPVPNNIPYAPRHLNDEGKKEWRRIVGVLINLGLYTVVDHAALAMYCQAWGRWIELERELETEGVVLLSDKGNYYQNPKLGAANRAWEQIRKILPEFGFTPSSRSRLVVGSGSGRDEKSLAELLFAEVSGKDVHVSDE